MSGGGSVKHFFEQPAVEDSRVFAQLGRTFGWQGLTDEAKHNQQNPGRAITKAGEYAAAAYLGGLLGGAGDAAAVGAEATPAVTDAAITASQLGSASEGASLYGAGALNGMAGGNAALSQAMLPEGSMESALQDTGYTPSSLRYAFQNANAGNGTSLSQNLSNYAQDGMTNLQNGSTFNRVMAGAKSPMGKQMMLQQGAKLLSPQQPQAMPHGMPAPQGPQGPLTNPYASTPYGPGGNSMGPPPLTEREKALLRAHGYQI